MNWSRTILDGVAMALLFNAVVGVGFLIYPQAYTTMFPKEIKEAAAPFVDKKEVQKMKLIIYPLYLLLFVYWAVSAHFAEIQGFWTLFWTGYVEMTIVSISDFLILDCWLPPKAKPYIKGADHCKAWEVKEWLIKLAIPEHALGWTFLVCPIAGLIVAGIGTLLGQNSHATGLLRHGKNKTVGDLIACEHCRNASEEMELLDRAFEEIIARSPNYPMSNWRELKAQMPEWSTVRKQYQKITE